MVGIPDLGPRFTPVHRLGEGGMAQTWLVDDRDTGERVVAKIAATGTGPGDDRWLFREGEILSRLDHPGIVRARGIFTAGSRPFLVMEYLPGGDIGRFAGRPPAELLPLLIQIAEALQYAHHEGVVHRDLKASNVLLDSTGRVRVSDFGIADDSSPTRGNPSVQGGGSRSAASPQQLLGRPASPADDLYGLGALMYTLITGRPPLGTDPTDQVILDQVPGEMTSAWPIPPRLQSLVTRLLAKNPKDRPPNMEEVLSELREVQRSLGDRTVPPRLASPTGEVKLTPPPRPPAIGTVARPGHTAGRGRHLGLPAPVGVLATSALLTALGALVVVVFVLLPGWVQRPPGSDPPTPAAGSEPAADLPPSADPEPAAEAPRRTGPAAGHRPPSGGNSPRDSIAAGRPVAADEVSSERPGVDAGFAAAMTEGLAALEAGEAAAARAAFELAQAIVPSSPEATEGLRRVERLERRQRIADLQRLAAAAEAQEDWRSAEQAYADVLAIDGNIAFAQDGFERSSSRRRLWDSIELHLARPDRLVDDDVLAEAEAVLERARAEVPSGPRFEELTARLVELVAVASTPVTVSLHSDTLTEVVIYKVGRLGTFARTTVQLRPGSYTVVGSRSGFQDVRLELTVRPDGPMPPVIIRCQDKV